MPIDKALAEQVEQRYQNELLGPFPLDDVRKLKSVDQRNLPSFHAGLDMYFAYVAGYASRARRLDRRPIKEIAEARQVLSKSFFERQPQLGAYSGAITKHFTPDLFRELEATESVRKQLLVLMDQILEEPVAHS